MALYTNQEVQQCISSLLNSSSSNKKEEDHLSNIIESHSLNLLPFNRALIDIIFRKISSKIDLLDLNEWKLLHVIFRHILLTSIGIERRCTEIRRLILLEAMSNIDCVRQLQSLVLSIATQNEKNEFIYYSQSDEIEAIDQLLLHLEQAIDSNSEWDEVSSPLLLLMMYRSPLDLECLDKLKIDRLSEGGSELAEYLIELKNNYENEIEISNKYLDTVILKNAVSKKVASMYESNPYPRWTERLHSMNPTRVPLEQFTGVASFPGYRASSTPVDTMLIAGCGTGRHPIQVALNYPWIKIKAIDISYRSIGYATMMAEKSGVDNIEFSVCDILDLDASYGQYDMIDCIGVLHHLEQPEKGLKILLSRLADGGLIRLGLYSKSAREAIIRFRQNNSMDGSQLNPSVMREIRQQIIQKGDNEDRTILQLDDFYTLSGCRDLLFHEQETQYTIPELKDLLDRHNLTFLGLGLPHRSLISTIQQVCGKGANIHDIDNWHIAESHSPFIFSSMYNFFAQVQS